MKSSRSIFVSVAGLMFGVSWLWISYSHADQDNNVRPNAKLVEAADLAYKCTKAEYDVVQASVGEVCRWSKRLMEAELKNGVGNQAIADHVDRMRNLHSIV